MGDYRFLGNGSGAEVEACQPRIFAHLRSLGEMKLGTEPLRKSIARDIHKSADEMRVRHLHELGGRGSWGE